MSAIRPLLSILVAKLRWVTADELVSINRRSVEQSFLRDRGLIEGAAAAPINLNAYEGETGLMRLTVRLIHAVASAHAFEDGNKRTAFVGAKVFLDLNGAILAAPDEALVGEWINELIERKIDQEEMCRRLAPFVVLPE